MMRSRSDMRTDGIQMTLNHASGRIDHGKLSDGLQGHCKARHHMMDGRGQGRSGR